MSIADVRRSLDRLCNGYTAPEVVQVEMPTAVQELAYVQLVEALRLCRAVHPAPGALRGIALDAVGDALKDD